MQALPDTSRSDCDSDDSIAPEYSKPIASGKQFFQNLKRRANSTPLTEIFKLYSIKISGNGKYLTCPFRSHKGGKERTPSFAYYPDTNSFYCHGCMVGGPPTSFVEKIDNISISDAVYKIIDIFDSELESEVYASHQFDFAKKLELLMDFSDTVRDFISSNSDPAATVYIEKITSVFDKLYSKHTLDNTALESLISKLKNQIKKY